MKKILLYAIMSRRKPHCSKILLKRRGQTLLSIPNPIFAMESSRITCPQRASREFQLNSIQKNSFRIVLSVHLFHHIIQSNNSSMAIPA